jgi:signal transduction histidine kinase
VARGLQPGQADLKEECEQNLRNLDTLIENIRRLSRELSPSSLEDIGLSAALGRLVAGIARDRRLQFSLDVADVDHLFPAEAQINVFRVFQEALSNIEKHSEATHISLVVGRRDGGVSFTLEDDGKGFDLHGIDRKVGLTTMFERGRMLGGTLDVVRTDKGGTRITLTIPIPD